MKRNRNKNLNYWMLISAVGVQAAFVLPAYAVPIFNITTATKSITVSPGQTINITYLVKNVSGISMPQMRYYPPAGTTITAASTCGTNLANLASCNIVLKYTAPSSIPSSQQLKLGALSVCGFGGKTCSKADSANLVTINLRYLATLVAGGQSTVGASPPILAQSIDGGTTWAFQTVTGLPASGSFNGASCTGTSGTDIVCAAAGGTGFFGVPFIASSTDAGATWSIKSVTNSPVNGNYLSASCTGSGTTAVCAASGNTSPFGGTLLVAASTDGAATWSVKPIAAVPTGSLDSVSCTGSGSSSICAAAGTSNNAPVLVVSTDGANNWAIEPVSGIPASGTFVGSGCSGSGTSAICLAVGINFTDGNAPLIAASTDGANTWAVKSISGATTGRFIAASCSGDSPSSTVCIAAGTNPPFGGSLGPLLAVSTDGANTWAITPIAGAPVDGILNNASCTGSGTSIRCVVAGGAPTTVPAPLLAASTDGGVTWSVKPISGAPVTGSIRSTSCTGNGSTAVCIAVGTGASAPFLAISTDGANTWSSVSIFGNPLTGSYASAGSTGG